MRLIPRSSYQNMRWKNGLGTTEQIESQPGIFRISAAHISNSSSFSDYPGQKRWLAIWKGQGLMLNQYHLTPDQAYHFSGEDKIICQNLSPEVIDVGVIYDPNKVEVAMSVLTLGPGQKIDTVTGLQFLFCAEGRFQIGEIFVLEGDTLKLHSNAQVYTSAISRIIHIQMTNLR